MNLFLNVHIIKMNIDIDINIDTLIKEKHKIYDRILDILETKMPKSKLDNSVYNMTLLQAMNNSFDRIRKYQNT
jgi:hypothetical protein